MAPASCIVLDEVSMETLISVAAGCSISAIEVESVAHLCSLLVTCVDSVTIAFMMSLRVGSDSFSIISSSDDAGPSGGLAFFLFLVFSSILGV